MQSFRTSSYGRGRSATGLIVKEVSAQALVHFRSNYPIRSPKFSGQRSEEMILLGPEHGLRLLAPAPATDFLRGSPPLSLKDGGANRYLWVIDSRGIPYIIEAPVDAIGNALPKHTNLTGGGEAYLGGEMWFKSDVSLYISGGSGRYPSEDENQLDAARQVFEAFDYEVVSLGWDHSFGAAARVLEAAQ